MNRRKKNLLGLVIVLALASVCYRLIVWQHYSHTGLMFMGLPLILAILIIVTGPARSDVGRCFRVVTLFLLMLGVLAWEGFICILMAAPLFYFFCFIAIALYKFFKRSKQVKVVASIPLILLVFEGTHPNWSFERNNKIELSYSYDLSEEEFLHMVAVAPVFDSELPLFFQLGFPYPLEARASGSFLQEGVVEYELDFYGPKKLANRLRVYGEQVSDNEIVFRFPEDSTKVGSWLHWQEARMTWERSGDQLKLTFEVQFYRDLDPCWYFAPIQRYAVSLASEYLLVSWFDE